MDKNGTSNNTSVDTPITLSSSSSSSSSCPCKSFSSSAQVISALSSKEKTGILIEWIKGSTIHTDGEEFEQVTVTSTHSNKFCGRSTNVGFREEEGTGTGTGLPVPSKCIHRVGAAYFILNAIRDGCREFLEQDILQSKESVRTRRLGKETIIHTSTSTSTSTSTNTGKQLSTNNVTVSMPGYNDTFPSLGSTSQSQSQAQNILKPRKKIKPQNISAQLLSTVTKQNAQPSGNYANTVGSSSSNSKSNSLDVGKKKVKRRIRPAPVAPAQQSPWGNIGVLQTNLSASSTWPKTRTISKNLISTKTTTSKDPMARAMSNNYTSPFKSNKKQNVPLHVSSIKAKKPILLGDSTEQINMPRKPKAEEVMPMSERIDSATSSLRAASLEDMSETPDRPPLSGSSKSLLDNTVNAYCTIIKSQLAPSIALEVQLMLRLLCICGEDKKEVDKNGIATATGLKKLFSTNSVCRHFAIEVLQNLDNLIVNFDRDILLSLLGIKSFVNQLPQIAKSIEHSLESQRNAMLTKGNYGTGNEGTSLVASSQSTILTMPFQEERDSRHNYRSRDQTSMYNNREQCRDAFLFQLREFQQMRGTVLNPTQIQQSINGITLALRQMMQQLFPSNLPWFAELFTDLLLQIGLVPMQELDADILKNVADKDRLQKLHSRFTSKVAQKNKSSKALVLRSVNSGPAPEEFFREHQEFFYLFIDSVDSYSFCFHLEKRLVHLVLTLSSIHDDRGLERRIAELNLLSKFLGLLVFSPNWNVTLREEPTSHYFAPTIPINNIIKDAYKAGVLIACIPWIVNFLRMMSWDSVSKRIPYYKETFSILRCIQKVIVRQILEGCAPLGTNLLPIAVQLDSIVDIIGIVEVEQYPDYKLPKASSKNRLDSLAFRFSSQFVFSSCAHLDDLQKLAADLARNGTLVTGNGTSKKLKPHILSTNPNYMKDRFGPLNALDQGKLQGFLSKNPTAERMNGPRKLVDAFFHQHKHLQLLCEFLIDYSIDNILSKLCLDECITPTLTNIAVANISEHKAPSPLGLDWYLQTLERIENESTHHVVQYTRNLLHNYIFTTMNTLVPPYVDSTVKEIAIDLCIDHAVRRGNIFVSSLVRTEAKKVIDSQLKQPLEAVKVNASSLDHDLILSISELTSSSDNILSGSSRLNEEFRRKVEAVMTNFAPFDEKNRITSSAILSAVNYLLRILTKVVSTWIEKQENQSANLHGFDDIMLLVTSIGRMGIATDNISAFGRLVSDTTTLKAIMHRSDSFNLKQFQHHCIHDKLMKKEDLMASLFDLLEGHQLSQDAAARTIQLVQALRHS